MTSNNDKPLITISGNESLLSDHLSTIITRDLPQEGVEWQRSYGRSSKIVYLEAIFVPLNDNHFLSANNELQLLNKPLLHTYWTDCCDVDVYKNSVKDDMNAWITKLKDNSINDWFIVHIDNSDSRKGNKSKLLPRSSILDKIKNDLPLVKSNVERCVTLLDTQRNDSKSTESYQQFLIKLRSLLLQSYSKQLIKYEDYIRTQRENRNSPKWNFFEFFFLQEELAFAFEMLSLYDEALVQYDELDALFSQFVINSNVGQMPQWLLELSEHYDTWHGLCLAPNVSKVLREQFKTGNATLLDLRNYLFSRQCELLFLLNKPWELASRSLPFLQNCVNELSLLEITMMPGGIACWVFLSSLEILQKCERYSDSSQMETYSLHTVGLWAYARNKLAELGLLCGLMPGMTMTSECLHKVVNLIAGMGHDPRIDAVPLSPQERLKEALSGQDAFLKQYLEISELTMGTYKHIGRMRFARLIGKELAQLYIKMSKPQKAIPFLIELEKVYLIEKWPQLHSDIRSSLLQCYQMIDDNKREFKVRSQLSASNHLHYSERLVHFNESEKLLKSLSNLSTEPLIIRLEEIFSIQDIYLQMKDNFTVTNCDIELSITFINYFPKAFQCNQLDISLNCEVLHSNSYNQKRSNKGCVHLNTLIHDQNKTKGNDIIPSDSKADIETFHSSIAVGVKCNNSTQLLKRSDSHGCFLIDKDPQIDDYIYAFTANDVIIEPGLNTIKMHHKTKDSGIYTLKQIILKWNSFAYLVSSSIKSHICFSVLAEEPSLKVLQLTTLDGNTSDILCGVEQSIVLQFNCGSYSFSENTFITIKASRGLELKLETDLTPVRDEISFQIPNALKPFQSITLPLIIKAKLIAQKDSSSIEHQLTMYWTPNECNICKIISVTFHLLPPFYSSFKLHTCNTRKFLEIMIHGVSNKKLILSKPRLKLLSDNGDNSLFELKANLPKHDSIISKDQTIHYLWEIIASNGDITANKALFSINYKLISEVEDEDNEYENYDYEFKLLNYQTLYTIKEAIEPQKETEFCRAGSLCHLNVVITRVNLITDHSHIMYEIISDQTLWNLSGRTAGVVAIEQTGKYDITFEVMPLISGFLPLPAIRISKYITSNSEQSEAKLVAFEVGQVYNWSRATQVHVLPSSALIGPDI